MRFGAFLLAASLMLAACATTMPAGEAEAGAAAPSADASDGAPRRREPCGGGPVIFEEPEPSPDAPPK
ncbi:MAG: hypothetical protein ABL957_16100 [Parvularculaceae bacterium]